MYVGVHACMDYGYTLTCTVGDVLDFETISCSYRATKSSIINSNIRICNSIDISVYPAYNCMMCVCACVFVILVHQLSFTTGEVVYTC